ncbi:MAG: DUF4199 domain-containing protein [Bacteroidales bacterium]|nr:DUF4199 domain-containing protein [Bacteroidales bacterium]MBN2633617.1 DUF4199 domain-containing protein [Bacteroidales bacterium]
MEKSVNVWKANLVNGLILGLIGVVFTLTLYFFDLIFNKNLSYLFMLVQIVILYFLVKSYRDNYLHGMINYGQALGAGVIIFLYTALIGSLFSFLLYSVIDPGLMEKGLAFTEEQYAGRGLTQEQIDAGLDIARKMMKPAITIPVGLVVSVFFGFIMSLIVAAFVRKEGNPLADTPAE